MRIVLFGPPGVGKGSQASLLQEREGATHISTGILLRRAIRADTELGREAKAYVEGGKLVPGSLVKSLAERAIEEAKFKHFVLDGYPRTIEQADWLDQFLDEHEAPLHAVVSIVVADDVIVDRLSKRRVNRVTGENFHLDFKPPPDDIDPSLIIQRADDKPEAIRKRLAVYKEKTAPVEAHYQEKGLLREVDGEGSFDDVFDRIKQAIRQGMDQ